MTIQELSRPGPEVARWGSGRELFHAASEASAMWFDWDALALALALLAVLTRVLDYSRGSAILASVSFLASILGARQSHRRIEARARLERSRR